MRRTAIRLAAAVVMLAALPAGAVDARLSRVQDDPPLRFPHLVSPAYMGGQANPTQAAAVEIAREHDVIVAQRNTFKAALPAMRAANPDLVVLIYVNGMYTPPAKSFPEHWYAHDAGGDRVTTHQFGNWLMQPTRPEWQKYVSDLCGTVLRVAPYDGCFLDNLGTGPLVSSYVTDPPVDPHTGKRYTKSTWLAATMEVAEAVAAAHPAARVSGNGLGNGIRYFDVGGSTAPLFAAADPVMAEIFVRDAKEAVNKYRSETRWRQDVDMLAAADARGKAVIAVTKLWRPATAAQRKAWHKYALATFLLGTGGRSSFSFSTAKSFPAVTAGDPWTFDLGTPLDAYAKVGGAYRRTFSGGIALVNPTASPVTVMVPPGLRNLDGNPAGPAVRLGPNTGEVLLGHAG